MRPASSYVRASKTLMPQDWALLGSLRRPGCLVKLFTKRSTIDLLDDTEEPCARDQCIQITALGTRG